MPRYTLIVNGRGQPAIFDSYMSWLIIEKVEAPGCDKSETSLQLADRLVEYLNKQDLYNEQINTYEKFLKHIRDNFDCDNDAHRYGTPCRKCDASQHLLDWNSPL